MVGYIDRQDCLHGNRVKPAVLRTCSSLAPDLVYICHSRAGYAPLRLWCLSEMKYVCGAQQCAVSGNHLNYFSVSTVSELPPDTYTFSVAKFTDTKAAGTLVIVPVTVLFFPLIAVTTFSAVLARSEEHT